LKTEDLKDNRRETLKKVFNFLEVKDFNPKNLDQEYNVGKISRSEFLTKAIKKFEIMNHRHNPLRYVIGFISMWNQKRIIERAFRGSKHYKNLKIKKGKTYPQINEETRKNLEKILENDIKFWNGIE